jgi:hypothetical protein
MHEFYGAPRIPTGGSLAKEWMVRRFGWVFGSFSSAGAGKSSACDNSTILQSTIYSVKFDRTIGPISILVIIIALVVRATEQQQRLQQQQQHPEFTIDLFSSPPDHLLRWKYSQRDSRRQLILRKHD